MGLAFPLQYALRERAEHLILGKECLEAAKMAEICLPISFSGTALLQLACRVSYSQDIVWLTAYA